MGADIITIILVVPIFSGLSNFVTTKGCLLGIFSGLSFVVVWGWVEFGTFMAGLEMVTLMCFGNTDVQPEGYSPYACGPWYAWRSAIIFVCVPIVTAIFTYGMSYIERLYEKITKIYAKLEDLEAKDKGQRGVADETQAGDIRVSPGKVQTTTVL